MNFKNAKWITYPEKFDRNIIYFKKDFLIHDDLLKAELFISGLGFYDFQINDIYPKQGLFKPNISDYKKRDKSHLLTEKNDCYFAYYDKYDITKYLLKNKSNTLFVRVGTGYFHLNDKLDSAKVDYGQSRLIFVIKMVYKNDVEYVVSDESTLSMLSQNKSSLYLGDDVDFNKEKMSYKKSVVINDIINLKKEEGALDKVFRRIKGNIIYNSPRRLIVDFGFNHSGNLSGYIKGKKGCKIAIKYAEAMNDDGTLNLASSSYEDYKSPNEKEKKIHVYQINRYVLSGNKDLLQTLFSYRCYRYVEIIGEEDFQIKNIYSEFIHGEIKQNLFLKCNNQVINDLYNKYILTQYNNFHSGVSTDCPHREKLSYTGDTALIRNNLLYFFDYEKQMYKFLKDIYASQGKDGFIPYSAPDFATGGGYFWSLSIALIPLSLMYRTGKMSYIKESLPYLEKFVGYFASHLDDRGVVKTDDKFWLLGDWLSPGTSNVDVSFFSTACYYLAIKYLTDFKKILGQGVGQNESDLMNKVKKVLIDNYYHKETHTFANDRQGETVLGAYLDIVDDPLVKKHIEDIYTKNPHFDTGIIMTPMLVDYLINNGMEGLLFKMLNRKDYPSYYYMMNNETTLPEHWKKKWPPFKTNNGSENIQISGDTSHCHPMFGSILYAVIKHIIGLDLTNVNKKIIVFNYKKQFGINEINIKYKNNSIDIKDGKMTINVAKGYQIEFDGKIHQFGKYIIKI